MFGHASRIAFLMACAGATGAMALPPEVGEAPGAVQIEAAMIEVDPGMPAAGDLGGADVRRPGAARGLGA